MRFMTLELLQDETDQGPQKWEEACELSWREFQKCRKKLPDDLVSHLENGFFHDYFIDDIHIRRRREKDRRIVFDLELKMENSALLARYSNSPFSIPLGFCFKC